MAPATACFTTVPRRVLPGPAHSAETARGHPSNRKPFPTTTLTTDGICPQVRHRAAEFRTFPTPPFRPRSRFFQAPIRPAGWVALLVSGLVPNLLEGSHHGTYYGMRTPYRLGSLPKNVPCVGPWAGAWQNGPAQTGRSQTYRTDRSSFGRPPSRRTDSPSRPDSGFCFFPPGGSQRHGRKRRTAHRSVKLEDSVKNQQRRANSWPARPAKC